MLENVGIEWESDKREREIVYGGEGGRFCPAVGSGTSRCCITYVTVLSWVLRPYNLVTLSVAGPATDV